MNTSLWQSKSWEDFQKAQGKTVHRINISENPLLILNPLLLGYSYGYISRCPAISKKEERRKFVNELTRFATKEKVIFTRMDFEEEQQLENIKSRRSHSVQPETSLLLDLNMTEDEILSQMKRKGRYNISLAQKKKVEIKMAKGNEEKMKQGKIFFDLLKETTDRDTFRGHELHYYALLLKKVPEAEIFTAYYEETPLASAITTFHEKRATYYYGASTHKNKEVMAPYLLQWDMIREAKRRGCESYDFLGIAPEDAGENHPWKGISSFKKKFGGKIIQYPSAIDIIHKPICYSIYKALKFLQIMIKK